MYTVLTICALCIYGLLRLGFSGVISGSLDLLNLYLVYVAFGLAGLVGIWYDGGSRDLVSFLGYCMLWLAAACVGVHLGRDSGFSRQNTGAAVPGQGRFFDSAAVVIVSCVYVAYLSSIIRSGIFASASPVDERFRVFEQSKVLFYAFSAVSFLPPVLIFRICGKITLFGFFIRIFPFWAIEVLTFSKTGLLYPLIAWAIYRSLLVKTGIEPKRGHRKQVYQLLFAGVFVYVAFWTVNWFTSAYLNPLNFLLGRLFSAFDSLAWLSTIDLSQYRPLSLWQWYFSPYLKVCGLFTQKYHAANYFLAVEYFGYGFDYSGMLPNNNNIAEIVLTSQVWLRACEIACFGGAYGAGYSLCIRYLNTGGWFVMPAAFYVATPLGLLIDGQGWFIALTCNIILGFLVLVIRAVVSLLRVCGQPAQPAPEGASRRLR